MVVGATDTATLRPSARATFTATGFTFAAAGAVLAGSVAATGATAGAAAGAAAAGFVATVFLLGAAEAGAVLRRPVDGEVEAGRGSGEPAPRGVALGCTLTGADIP